MPPKCAEAQMRRRSSTPKGPLITKRMMCDAPGPARWDPRLLGLAKVRDAALRRRSGNPDFLEEIWSGEGIRTLDFGKTAALATQICGRRCM
jgi:hypothetical protein